MTVIVRKHQIELNVPCRVPGCENTRRVSNSFESDLTVKPGTYSDFHDFFDALLEYDGRGGFCENHEHLNDEPDSPNRIS